MTATQYRIIRKLFNIERDEIGAALLSFLFVFTLMASYYVLQIGRAHV